MSTPKNHDFNETRLGDTVVGFNVAVTRDNSPVDLTGASVKMQIRKECVSGEVLRESTDADGITIVAPATDGILSIQSFLADRTVFQVGKHPFDIELTEASGIITTLVDGELPLVQDVTRS